MINVLQAINKMPLFLYQQQETCVFLWLIMHDIGMMCLKDTRTTKFWGLAVLLNLSQEEQINISHQQGEKLSDPPTHMYTLLYTPDNLFLSEDGM